VDEGLTYNLLSEIAQVNLPVAVLIWLIIIPMLVRIDFN